MISDLIQSEPDIVERSVSVTPPASQPRELDLFAFALLLLRNASFILGFAGACFIGMVGYMLHVKPRFASTAVMIVPQGNVTSSNITAQLSLSTMDLLGGGYELYADIIKSHRVADPLIRQFHLQQVYGTPKLDDTENVLLSLTKVQTSREGVIRVTVEDTDPNRAADLANGMLAQLDSVNSDLVLTSIGQQARFLETELGKEQNSLADAEVALKELQVKTGGLPPDSQANAGLNALTTTRAQLRADEIRLDSLRTSETDANPDIIRLRSEIAGLQGQVESLESGSKSVENGVPTSMVPAQTLEYTRRLREVKFHETLFDLLAKEYETAKQQQAKTPSIVQVLDHAVPSYKRAWPPRTYYCLIALVLGLVLAVLLVSLRAFAVSYLRNPRNRSNIEEFKALYRKGTIQASR